MDVTIRRASAGDVDAVTAIYNAYIVGSHVSFDEEPWTTQRRLEWLEAKADHAGHEVWVAAAADEVVGAAWSGPWRDKKGYERSVETTVVVAPGWTARGVGRTLYGALLDAAQAAGMHRAYAVVALPNDASLRLHRALGFRSIGVLDEVGYKLGAYQSTELLEKKLS